MPHVFGTSAYRHAIRVIIAAICILMALMEIGPAPANAAVRAPSSASPSASAGPAAPTKQNLSSSQVLKMSKALVAANKQVSVTTSGGATTRTFMVDGRTLVIVEPPAAGRVSAAFSVGFGWGLYIYLNRTDQGAVASGAAAAIAAAVCLTPRVDISCPIIAGALAVAAYYIAVHGICPRRMEVRIWNGSTIKCVK